MLARVVAKAVPVTNFGRALNSTASMVVIPLYHQGQSKMRGIAGIVALLGCREGLIYKYRLLWARGDRLRQRASFDLTPAATVRPQEDKSGSHSSSSP